MNELQRVLSGLEQPFNIMDMPDLEVTAEYAPECGLKDTDGSRLWVWMDPAGNKALVNDEGNGWYRYIGDATDEGVRKHDEEVNRRIEEVRRNNPRPTLPTIDYDYDPDNVEF